MPPEYSVADLIKRWPTATVARCDKQPVLCEDCGNGTDLGHKCRACYRQWQKMLWQDIPMRHSELVTIAKQLNIIGDKDRKLIADMVTGHANGRLSGSLAELYTLVKRCLEGPYGPQLEAKCQAIRAASDKPTTKRGARGEVD